MTGDVDHIVDPPHDPVITVGVDAGVVAGEVIAGCLRPVNLLEPLRVAPQTAEHARPGATDAEHAAAVARYRLLRRFIEQYRHDARQRLGATARLRGDRAR